MAGLGTINRYNRDCKFFLILIKKKEGKKSIKNYKTADPF